MLKIMNAEKIKGKGYQCTKQCLVALSAFLSHGNVQDNCLTRAILTGTVLGLECRPLRSKSLAVRFVYIFRINSTRYHIYT